MYKKLLLLCFSVGIFLVLVVLPVRAQESSLGAATAIVPNDKVKDGDIITSTKEGYKLARQAYDPLLFGVISMNPAVYLDDQSLKGAVPVVTLGRVYVRVSTANGPISKGDFITSSSMPGIGQKVTDNGYVLGTSEEEYTEKDPNKIGKVLVILNPHFAQVSTNLTKNVFSAFRLGLSAAFLTPIGALRYVVAGFVALLSFYLGFRYFGNASRSGVEAIGRNPLASKIILLSVVMNVTITLSIMFFGVALAYLILVL